MKNIFLFTILFAFIFSNCYSQNWLWANSGNGPGYDEGHSVSADSEGNVFETGGFGGPTLIFGSTALINVGSLDVYIVKYDANGNMLWAKSAGGTGNDGGYSVKAGLDGNVFLTGIFSSPTITFGTTTLTNAGNSNLFIAKYDSSGNLVWVKGAGGTSSDYSYAVSADASGNVFIAGFFQSSSITFGSTTLVNTGFSDIFIAKYDANGNVLWAKSIGGTSYDEGLSVSADTSGNVFLTGEFNSPTITFGTYALSNTDGCSAPFCSNIFLAKYDANGNVLWAKSTGGSGRDYSCSVSTDAGGNVFIAGKFFSSTLAFSSTILSNSDPSEFSSDIFIAKYDANGNVLWAKSAGGTFNDAGSSVSADAGGNVFLTGLFSSAAITFGSDTLIHPLGSTDPLFIVKYDVYGNVLCSSVLSSGGNSAGHDLFNNSVSSAPFGSAYIGGCFYANPLIVGTDTLPLTGQQNVYVAKFSCSNNVLVNELSDKENSMVYPNPSSGKFTVNFKNKTGEIIICVYDVLGNCVYDKVSMKKCTEEIDLSKQLKGIYFLEIMSESERTVKKIVLQ